ncbi:hypothetical protein D515_02569 [Grimontia indica]|uniref:Uncharacterized protein n=1 Tax=Grimontia indica TaxID=1056512 RepID=R1GZQ7_9GAMM|nr:hypothetical protein [Grimontia indica]EOD81599.1 hypothetical protein D515_02569 [Grimontia indica]
MTNYRELLDSTMVPDEALNTINNERWIDSSKLICYERIDIVVKLIYLESVVKGFKSIFFDDLYREHLECFSNGNISEPGNDRKNDFFSFEESFLETYESIKVSGFDEIKSLVPVSNGTTIILDGAHRTTCAIYLREKVKVIDVNSPPKKFDVGYFIREGLPGIYIDHICKKYIEMREDKSFHAICIWPVGFNFLKSIDKEINENFEVIRKKRISLNNNGAHNFLSQIYSHDDWVGNYENDYQGVSTKREACFKRNKSEFMLYFVESDKDLKYVTDFKNNLRSKFGFGKHLLHITDNNQESKQIAELLLNENSISMLNNSYPTKSKRFQEKLHLFIEQIEMSNIRRDQVCIIGGGVLAALGIRDTQDIDYIYSGDDPCLNGDFDFKNKDFSNYKFSVDQILNSPDKHFYYLGLKFCSLEIVRELKTDRSEPKDIDDIKAIDIYLSNEKSLLDYFNLKIFLLKRVVRRGMISIRIGVGNVLRFLGIIDEIKKVLGMK